MTAVICGEEFFEKQSNISWLLFFGTFVSRVSPVLRICVCSAMPAAHPFDSISSCSVPLDGGSPVCGTPRLPLSPVAGS